MISDCPIRVTCKTKALIKAESITHDVEGNPTESYDSIIRRAIQHLKEGNNEKIGVKIK